MREIKFRGIHIDSGSMVYGDLIRKTDFDGKQYFEIEQSVANDYHNWTVKPGTIGQFIGLKDSCNSEIWEGDVIISGTNTCGLIEYGTGRFGINWDYKNKSKTMLGSWGQIDNIRGLDDGFSEEIEVIGNIHQNPELLKA